ncbi:MAG: tetratricopeptide repeat protein [Bacteroidales bacterium]|nr:tetratricopeptide repeat protein [Bacteroidales bacterium]
MLLWVVSAMSLAAEGQTNDSVPQTKGKKDDFRKEMRAGNKLYDGEKPLEAETAYRKALNAKKDNDNATFNLGDALYRQKKYDEAGKQFEKAATLMTEKEDKARAFYNLGNSFLQQQKLKEGIEAYKQALRNDPNDVDTKTNLSYALKMLQQQQQQQQNQDNKDKDKDQQEQDKNQQDKNQQDKDQQDQQDQQQISPEDAQRMLDALSQEEKDLQEKLKKKERAGYRSKIEKNW